MTIKTPDDPSFALNQLIATVHRLRAPGGCPWDQAQTHQSLRPYLIEEAHEVLDVLDQIHSTNDLKVEKIKKAFCEELGDLLMQVLLHSEMANEAGIFNIYEVAQQLNDKLIRRHPHVFGNTVANSADSAFQTWEKEKAKEKASTLESSILDGLPKGLPALQRAARVLEKVTKAGFQWNDIQGPMNKLDEEVNELKAEIQNLTHIESPEKESVIRKRVESELGDVFLTLCNLSHLMNLTPEDSLRSTMARFEKRFRYVEKRLKEKNKTPDQSHLEEMDLYWEEAKKLEKIKVIGLTGGIASGKSAVAKILSEIGFPVVDADEISHHLIQENGLAYHSVIKRFGTANREELRKIIFSDPQAKRDLEAILHPLIQFQSQKEILKLSSHSPIIIYEASLLVETGRFRELNGLIAVEASPEIRLKRLLSRKGISAELAQTIMSSQFSDQERRTHANWILENSTSLEALRLQILELIQKNNWYHHFKK